MIVDVSGIWPGMVYTDGLTHLQGLASGGDGWGGPPRTDRVTLWISSQGEYKNFGYGQVVSPISGQLDGFAFYSIAVSGFLDDRGLVKLSFFLPTASEDWTFNGRLRVRGLLGDISGNWTRMSWSNGWFLHQLGSLQVQKRVYRFSDRAYLVPARGREF